MKIQKQSIIESAVESNIVDKTTCEEKELTEIFGLGKKKKKKYVFGVKTDAIRGARGSIESRDIENVARQTIRNFNADILSGVAAPVIFARSCTNCIVFECDERAFENIKSAISVRNASMVARTKGRSDTRLSPYSDPTLEGKRLAEFIRFKELTKEGLTEAEEPSEDIAIDNINATPDSEIADAVQKAAEVATNNEETFSDAKATAIAKEIKTYARGFDTAAWAPLDVTSELTDKLDDCLANAMAAHAAGTSDGVDLLITGLPGSGKTGIVKQWAKDRGVNLFYLNAKNDDLGAILNGFPVDTVETDEDGNEVHKVIRSFSKSLDKLDEPNSVLFLDEFNRAPSKLRAVLLSLVNEHVVDGPGKDGFRHFDNMLFTVACINPSVPTDPGAMDLNDAEMSRFVDSMDWDSKVPDAIKYIRFHLKKLIEALKPEDENYNFFYVRYNKILNLADALLGAPTFEFDSRDDLSELFNEKAKMLNQRAITDALMSHGYNKEKFLNWVDRYSNFLDKDKQMIHDILDSWTEPVVVPIADTGDTENTTEQPIANNNATEDSGDFDSIFGNEGEELDNDLFNGTASNAGKAARVSSADALARIKAFDFSL